MHIEKIAEKFPYCGESLIKEFLVEKETAVERMSVRDSLHQVNSDGVNAQDEIT